MSFAGARSRLRKLEKANPPTHPFDWRVFTGEVEPGDLDSEPWPGHGMTWRQIIEEPPVDPLAEAIARLPQKAAESVPLPLPPEDTAEAQPSATEVDRTTRYEPDYPPGYEPEADDEPQPEGDDDAACD